MLGSYKDRGLTQLTVFSTAEIILKSPFTDLEMKNSSAVQLHYLYCNPLPERDMKIV